MSDRGPAHRVRAKNIYLPICVICFGRFEHRHLTVHHIDHDKHNNEIENLCYACRTCHDTIHHYEDLRDFDVETFRDDLRRLALSYRSPDWIEAQRHTNRRSIVPQLPPRHLRPFDVAVVGRASGKPRAGECRGEAVFGALRDALAAEGDRQELPRLKAA